MEQLLAIIGLIRDIVFGWIDGNLPETLLGRASMAPWPGAIPGLQPGIELLQIIRPFVRECGEARRPAWHLPARKLLDFLVVYIAEGRGRFIVGGVEYEAEADDLFWIPPDTVHDMAGFAPHMVCPYVHFDLLYRPEVSHWGFSIPGGMTDLADFAPLLHPPVPHAGIAGLCGRLRAYTNARVGDVIREICAEAARGRPYGQLRMSALLLELVVEVLRGQAGLPAESAQHVPKLEQAARWLRNHLGNAALQVEEAAAVAELSTSHFRKLFTSHYSQSPQQYLRSARIRRAKSLMLESGLNLTEIARAVGFVQLPSFTRAFKAVEGMTPSQYRGCAAQALIRVESREAPHSH